MEARIIQTPSLVAVLHADLTYRQIFMDGRALESDPNPTWMGYSVGWWENDTLVVESAGFNDRTWLDRAGHPHTEGLRTTERYRRLNFGRMELLLTYEDRAVYAKPFTLKIDMSLAADTEMLEYVCNENEKDRAHMIGQASDLQKHAVEQSSRWKEIVRARHATKSRKALCISARNRWRRSHAHSELVRAWYRSPIDLRNSPGRSDGW